jgi:hypothetical protein
MTIYGELVAELVHTRHRYYFGHNSPSCYWLFKVQSHGYKIRIPFFFFPVHLVMSLSLTASEKTELAYETKSDNSELRDVQPDFPEGGLRA